MFWETAGPESVPGREDSHSGPLSGPELPELYSPVRIKGGIFGRKICALSGRPSPSLDPSSRITGSVRWDRVA